MSESEVKNWQLPFSKKKDKQITPSDYLTALSEANDGFYPMSCNNLWHGGIHLNQDVIKKLNGENAIGCIAEGNVIAYRIDNQYAEADYSSSKASFSTGFTLVHHVLAMPPILTPAESEPKPTQPAVTTTAPIDSEQPTEAPTAEQANLPDNIQTAKTPESPKNPAEAELAEHQLPNSLSTSAITLNLYSLYMHLSDWQSYEKNPDLTQPAYWNSQNTEFVVGKKAKDSVLGCVVRENGRKTNVLALLPRGAQVRVGAPITPHSFWRKLESIESGVSLPALPSPLPACYVYTNEMQLSEYDNSLYIVTEKGSDTQPNLLGLNVREAPSGKSIKLSVLPRGTRIKISTLPEHQKNKGWGKLESIIEGSAYPPLAQDSNGLIKGWVYLPELEAMPPKPQKTDEIVILDKPFPIKSGDLIGYPGLYQRLTDAESQIAPAPLLHFELFTCDNLPALIAQSRTLAAKLDTTQKNMLLVHKEALLHKPSVPDRTVDSEVELTLVKNSKSSGCWTEVCTEKSQIYALIIERNKLGKYSAGQYETKQESSKKAIQTLMSKIGAFVDINDIPDLVTFDRKYYHDTDNSKSMPSPTNGHSRRGIIFTIVKRSTPFWVNHVDVNEQGKRTDLSATINAWTTYPLQKDKNTLEFKTGFTCLLTSTEINQKPKIEWAIDHEGKAWWFIHSADNNGQNISGWIKEEIPTASRHSPWEWPLFEQVSENATPSQQLDRMNRKALLDPADRTPLMQQLHDIIAEADGCSPAELNPTKLKQAIKKPWLAQQITRLTVNYESEWYADENLSKWNALDDLLDEESLPYWQKDKEQRIKKLIWWDKLAGKHGLSTDGKAWFFHPVGFVGNFNFNLNDNKVTVSFLEKILNKSSSWFNGKGGGKRFENHFKNTYSNIYQFDKEEFVNLLNLSLIKYDITGPYHIAHFLSQCFHESAHFETTVEFASGNAYEPGVHSQAIRNGNTQIGDGAKYKGRGLIQLTWKNNYEKYSKYRGIDFVIAPELIASDMSHAIDASCWYWRFNGAIYSAYNAQGDINKLIDNDKNNVRLITRAVNGGTNGLIDRTHIFNKIKKEWALE